jgi:hypothetical protein
LYSSQLSAWRKAAREGSLQELGKKRGPRKRPPVTKRWKERARELENRRLREDLRRAHLAAGQARIALTGGVNLATVEGTSIYGGGQSMTGISAGFSAGLSAIIPVPGGFEIELGSVYSQRGRADSYTGSGLLGWDRHDTDRSVETVSGDYLGLMALGRASLPLAENGLRAFLMAGPALSWEASCHVSQIHHRVLALGLTGDEDLDL